MPSRPAEARDPVTAQLQRAAQAVGEATSGQGQDVCHGERYRPPRGRLMWRDADPRQLACHDRPRRVTRRPKQVKAPDTGGAAGDDQWPHQRTARVDPEYKVGEPVLDKHVGEHPIGLGSVGGDDAEGEPTRSQVNVGLKHRLLGGSTTSRQEPCQVLEGTAAAVQGISEAHVDIRVEQPASQLSGDQPRTHHADADLVAGGWTICQAPVGLQVGEQPLDPRPRQQFRQIIDVVTPSQAADHRFGRPGDRRKHDRVVVQANLKLLRRSPDDGRITDQAGVSRQERRYEGVSLVRPSGSVADRHGPIVTAAVVPAQTSADPDTTATT